MATYVIGDVQGCFHALMKLLKNISFNTQNDRLIFCGDLVNRGGRSIDVLRWIYAHQCCCDSVLGNHDLSLLSKHFVPNKTQVNQEFQKVYQAPDAELIINWLINRPLFLQHENDLIIHAGLYPFWSIEQFIVLATQTHQHLIDNPVKFFTSMFGNNPKLWSNKLKPTSLDRFVINACTRMRFLNEDGALNFSENRRISGLKGLEPWFKFEAINHLEKHIIFGHWSALGLYQDSHVTCLDTGKVWGGQLTAMRLEDRKLFSV